MNFSADLCGSGSGLNVDWQSGLTKGLRVLFVFLARFRTFTVLLVKE